jgi:hypothetical protein
LSLIGADPSLPESLQGLLALAVGVRSDSRRQILPFGSV